MTLDVLTAAASDSSYPDRSASTAHTHRTSLGEIFILGDAETRGRRLTTVGQVPLTNLYYNDHTALSAFVDPLVLIEIVRQSSSCIAHATLGLSTSAKFILNELSFDLTELQFADLDARRSIAVNTTVEVVRERRGVPQTALFTSELFNGSDFIGWVKFETTFLTAAVYGALRIGKLVRGGSVETAQASEAVAAVAPELVARRQPNNVVISSPVMATDLSVRCLIQPQFTNASMFEHAQDHVPGMVIVEACRQAAALTLGASALMVRGAFSFFSFLENDAQASLTAASFPDQEGSARLTGEVSTMESTLLASFELTLAHAREDSE